MWLQECFLALKRGFRRAEMKARRRRRDDGARIQAAQVLRERILLSAPEANSDHYFVTQDVTLEIPAPGLLSNDFDADDDSLTAALDAGPAHGSVTINSDGSFEYTPDSGFVGIDTFTYVANDGTDDSLAATVTITVVDAAGDALSTAQDVALVPNDTVELYGFVSHGAEGAADADLYRVTLNAGDQLTIDIDADELDDSTELSALDSYLRIFDANGTELDWNDDAYDPNTSVFHLDSGVRQLRPKSIPRSRDSAPCSVIPSFRKFTVFLIGAPSPAIALLNHSSP